MAKTVILAVAGAGKTYHICHTIDPTKKNLVLAYTHENLNNIRRELCDAHGNIPELTTIETFDSFVYHNLILPYEPSIAEHFHKTDFRSKGITLCDPPPQRIKNKYNSMVPNPAYQSKERFRHYITAKGQYYCSTLSELALQVKKGRDSLIKRAAARINLFYDAILIDEFQDFREHDYDLIMGLSKHLNNVTLVGDYYQHSVSATNNSGKPFSKKKKTVTIVEFVTELQRNGFFVDQQTLSSSRRCSAEVCEYVKNKLGVDIVSNSDHCGSVIWVDKNPEAVLDNDQITKLVFQEAASYTFKSMNWSYSKGDTVSAACVILTASLDSLCNDSFSASGTAPSTLNKLYVAMTRSFGDLYLMKDSVFKTVKDHYTI